MSLSFLSKSEVKRRLVHVSGAAVPLGYLLDVISWRRLTLMMLLFSAVVTVLEFLRLRVGLDWAIYDELTRSYEQTNLAGYALYMYSMTAVALVFEPYVAVPGMLMLAVGDPVSGLLGRTREAGESKRLRTLAAMFLVCLAVSAPILYPLAGSVGLLAAVAGSAGATAADGMKPVVRGYVIDDNASIPPAACLAIAAVLWVVDVPAV
ncbi:dolichol kinase [Halogeometricum pallidum JCM 14848]|uniref:Dolichol kinase n=1 Tax=Halogeometricum pallidum JCM 14848 TaxID=1227487 RepID=M0D9N1_HALPD|nr:dolichol kinase [Halogeometricum pallidum]ELZ30869.1 dolichol kinase [Halogeometricum pallidum JCM 14848]